MARTVTLTCDFCGKLIESVACKMYLAPILPGKTITSFQGQYTHYGDACNECMVKFQEKMKRRQARNNGNGGKPKKSKRVKR